MAKKQATTFLGPSKGLSVSGAYLYAYSGELFITDDTTDLLSFVTGKWTSLIKIQFFYSNEAQGDDVMFKISLNGSLISTLQIGGSTTVNTHGNDWDYLELVIPPLTNVLITGENISDTDPRTVGSTVTGRIYE